MKLLFIRHAETQTNVNQLTHKTGDPIGLTELEQKQAQQLTKVCKEEKVEIVFFSPEQRAVETAEIIAKELNIDLKILQELAERNWGEWEGKPWVEIETVLYPMTLEQRYTFVPPNGESWEQMEARLKQGLDKIIKSDYVNVGVITHEGALRGLMPILLNSLKETSFKYHFENGSITSFEYKDGVFVELKVNTTLHLN
ncbi:MAG TPA: histidine phosphatase family protein [Candidatus Paceibacterota bacterium]|jgi:broad specificity phosphatase PhoE|nr:histidine phosphatase family protein [Candidatus Paceibacterota bacterium]